MQCIKSRQQVSVENSMWFGFNYVDLCVVSDKKNETQRDFPQEWKILRHSTAGMSLVYDLAWIDWTTKDLIGFRFLPCYSGEESSGDVKKIYAHFCRGIRTAACEKIFDGHERSEHVSRLGHAKRHSTYDKSDIRSRVLLLLRSHLRAAHMTSLFVCIV